MHYLSLLVKPHAKATAWTGVYTDLMGKKVYTCSLNAPAHDGEANTALIAFVAQSLKLPIAWIRIVQGKRGRHKVVAIDTDAPELDFSFLQT